MASGFRREDNETYPQLSQEYANIALPTLTFLAENLLREYVESMLSNYIRYQAEMLYLLGSFTFRSPLNFIMVKHDFQIFLREFLRCEAKLKYGYNFIQQSLLVNYNIGELNDGRKAKYEIGVRFLKEKDNCKAKVCNLFFI